MKMVIKINFADEICGTLVEKPFLSKFMSLQQIGIIPGAYANRLLMDKAKKNNLTMLTQFMPILRRTAYTSTPGD